jgi:threo-3-hydroxy-L-aspartate ammonia-lyase
MRFMLFRMKLLVEPSGAAAAAAVFARKPAKDLNHVGVILSGGNIDPDALGGLLSS